MYRAFFRIYCLQLVIVNLVLAAAFAPWDRGALSSAVVTHAWLSALERMANWWLSRNPRDPLRRRAEAEARAQEAPGGRRQSTAEGAAATGSHVGRWVFGVPYVRWCSRLPPPE